MTRAVTQKQIKAWEQDLIRLSGRYTLTHAQATQDEYRALHAKWKAAKDQTTMDMGD